jgi:alpha-N-arabinofuranosidase
MLMQPSDYVDGIHSVSMSSKGLLMPAHRITRRNALKQVVQGTSAIAAAAAMNSRPARGAEADSAAKVEVLLGERGGVIKPAIYGQFAEHIGGVIYDGIWVGRDSKIKNTNGIRQELIDHVRRLGPVVIRWPGGCFADRYHWRDGIGDPAKRPRRFGRWQEDTESNQFGTHEFIDFCRVTKTEPYLAGNVGTGTAEEFQQWIEYCNTPAGRTTLADERVANGDKDPFGVKMWGVGNESWGCGGKFTPEDYCTEYRKYTEWLPSYGVPLYLIGAGPNSNDLDWTRRFFKKWTDGARAPMNAWAAHYYCGTTGHALEFTQDQWYEMFDKAYYIEQLIKDQWAAMGEFDRDHRVKLIIDEWGAWHPAGTEINKHHLFEQMGCLRDALVAALSLDVFNAHAEKIDMTNIAQLVNNLHSLFLADGDQFVATPTFHVFEMYRPHQNGTAVRLAIDSGKLDFKAGNSQKTLFDLAGSASVNGKRLTVTLVHTNATEPREITLSVKDAKATAVQQTTLTHSELNAHNTFESPDTVKPTTAKVDQTGDQIKVTLPPACVVRFDVTLG